MRNAELRHRGKARGSHTAGKKSLTDSHTASQRSNGRSVMATVSLLVGLLLMFIMAFQYSSLMETLHDNQLWFSNIQEVEREISFRTESGLYYSYYKTFIEAPTLMQGFRELIYDNVTEHGRTINIIERFNIFQEIFLGIVYKLWPSNVQPIYLYIRSVFALHGVLICILYLWTWFLSGSWFAGALTAAFYIFNKQDTTRAIHVIPLRESFALPFLWGQILCINLYMSNRIKNKQIQRAVIAGIALCSLNFTLTWQFAQFVLLLQAAALYVVWVLDYVPANKIKTLYFCQLGALFGCYLLQFGNKMVLGSLVLGIIPAVFLAMLIKKRSDQGSGIILGLGKAAFYSLFVAVAAFLVNKLIKVVINLDADEHIFKFVLNKFGIGNPRDFDTLLYMCNGAFEFLDFGVYGRMTAGIVFPLYFVMHVGLILLFILATFQNWGKKIEEQNNNNDSKAVTQGPVPSFAQKLFQKRPEMAYNTVQAVLFGSMAIMVMRMKYLWTPYMCVFGAVLLADQQLWSYINSKLPKPLNSSKVNITKHIVTGLALCILLASSVPSLMKELDNLLEFYDPDTVELMNWIKNYTAPNAAFTGSMQLLAGIKLCTKRPLLNHPHYEDKGLRQRTKELYAMYAKETPDKVHAVMKSYDVSYIILEDSICLSPKADGCRLPDIMDYNNGVLPIGHDPEEGLEPTDKPQFCDQIRYGSMEYTKYFQKVFENKTFRIYRVL